MEKLVIIGANDFQNQLILKAKSLGYETHVFAWEDGAVGKENADYFYPVSIIEKEEILRICKEIKPIGICSIASDLAVITVNYVAEKLELPCNKYKDTLKCTNKYFMREAFSRYNIPTPKFTKTDASLENLNLDGFKYPLIVKPTDRSGSRGINKVNNLKELQKAVKGSAQNSFEKKVIIEEFIEGDEYSCECISYNGEHHFLAFTKKFTTGSPHYIETGHMQPSDIDEKYHDKIKDMIFKALNALEIKNGASHSEFKIDKDGNVGIIEIGARMGGDCIGSDLVYLSTGYDFMKMVIDAACGKKPEIIKTGKSQTAEIRFIFNQNDINKLEQIKNENKVNIYRISNINYTNEKHVTDSSNRLGYYIYTY